MDVLQTQVKKRVYRRRRKLESPEERHMAALQAVATRRKRYGPSGHRPEGYDGLETPDQRRMAARQAVATRRARYGPSGHRPEGYDGLETAEQRSMAAQRAVATRRARYGPSGRRGGNVLPLDDEFGGTTSDYQLFVRRYALQNGLSAAQAAHDIKVKKLWVRGETRALGISKNKRLSGY